MNIPEGNILCLEMFSLSVSSLNNAKQKYNSILTGDFSMYGVVNCFSCYFRVSI